MNDVIRLGFEKHEVIDILKNLISIGAILLITNGAYKNKYTVSGKFLEFEFSFSPQR